MAGFSLLVQANDENEVSEKMSYFYDIRWDWYEVKRTLTPKIASQQTIPFAFIDNNGNWQGYRFGWAGVWDSDNEPDVYDEKYRQWIDSLAKDAKLYKLYCHI